MQAKDLNLFHTESQWVYVVTDTNSMDSNMAPFINMAHDGYNLAFVFNTSIAQDGRHCPSGILCLVNEMAELITQGLESTMKDEKWDIIKPDDKEKAVSVLQGMKSLLRTSCRCNNCTSWMMEVIHLIGSCLSSGFKISH